MKKQRGITLIALVVTIIVLIILAGVSINVLLGENGIITMAKQAKENMQLAQMEEQTKLNELYNQMGATEDLIPKLKVGDYIKYNTGVTSVGENGVIMCRVLYNDSTNGLQIISDTSVADVTLGGSDWETGKTAYNSAIVTLNNEAEKYLNTAYAYDARCVGSLPTVNLNGYFSEKDKATETTVVLPISEWISGASSSSVTYTRPNGWTSDDTGCYDDDFNSNTDDNAMKKIYGLTSNKDYYWKASRGVGANASGCWFVIAAGYGHIGFTSFDLCSVTPDGKTTGELYTQGLRPCFSLKSNINIIGGDGKTADTAYSL